MLHNDGPKSWNQSSVSFLGKPEEQKTAVQQLIYRTAISPEIAHLIFRLGSEIETLKARIASLESGRAVVAGQETAALTPNTEKR